MKGKMLHHLNGVYHFLISDFVSLISDNIKNWKNKVNHKWLLVELFRFKRTEGLKTTYHP